jgi:hypothetical protein
MFRNDELQLQLGLAQRRHHIPYQRSYGKHYNRRLLV